MNAPEAVTPVTLWLCECDGPGFESWRVESSDDVDVTLDRKFTALPAAQYAALVAERDALREALETLRPWHPTPCPLCGKAWQTLDEPSRIPAIRHLGNCYFARTALGAERSA